MPEVEIPCVQCKEIFIFSEKEQQLFYERNMPTPQRCTKCRSKKNASKAADPSSKFEIVCDNCGRHDRVPFQPKTGRTVLCRDCYQASRSRARVA
ncbi:MAG: zinc-ribbon domain containing protein [Pyrinomonadaceae bacterium]|nr:zinc-ribbon domain containing protein [Pyrinomonadaceae bacterium]